MTILFAVICGLIQGATEFLPVSSSGHLALFQNLFYKDPAGNSFLAFNVVLHLGTLIAVFIVFWRDIFPLIPAFFTMLGKLFRGKFKLSEYTVNERMVIMVILGTLPMIIAKVLDDKVEFLSTYVWVVGAILILNAVMLFFSDRIPRGNVNEETARPRNALVVGFAQCLAVLPGLSRSGTSITAGLTQRFNRQFAVKFSFILSIPAILGAAVFEIPDAVREGIPSGDVPAYLIGAAVALVSGVAAMKLLLFISKKANFRVFSYYCAVIGIAAIILGVTGTRFPIF